MMVTPFQALVGRVDQAVAEMRMAAFQVLAEGRATVAVGDVFAVERMAAFKAVSAVAMVSTASVVARVGTT